MSLLKFPNPISTSAFLAALSALKDEINTRMYQDPETFFEDEFWKQRVQYAADLDKSYAEGEIL